MRRGGSTGGLMVDKGRWRRNIKWTTYDISLYIYIYVHIYIYIHINGNLEVMCRLRCIINFDGYIKWTIKYLFQTTCFCRCAWYHFQPVVKWTQPVGVERLALIEPFRCIFVEFSQNAGGTLPVPAERCQFKLPRAWIDSRNRHVSYISCSASTILHCKSGLHDMWEMKKQFHPATLVWEYMVQLHSL